ncbi:MAG: glycosyltransferase [Candidatus Pristimantibacillus sp.]
MQVVFRHTLNDATGFGNAARNIVFAMEDTGVDIKVESIGNSFDFLEPAIVERLLRLQNKPSSGEQILVTLDPKRDPKDWGRFSKVISCVMWETSKLPDSMVNGCNSVDAVIVPNEFNRQVFKAGGVHVPIFISPYGVDSDLFTPIGHRERFGEDEDQFLFLSVFGWSHRKGPDVLINAFVQEFSNHEPVVLVIKSHKFTVNEPVEDWFLETVRSVEKTENQPKIRMITQVMSPEQTAAMYRGADCFVLPTRGEAVGLPILESMSSQIPVISTGWGGQIDFFGPGCGYPIPYQLSPVQPLYYTDLYKNDQLWANPDVGSLRSLMRKVYTFREEARQRGRVGRQIALGWNWSRSAAGFIHAIEATVGQKLV